jgi:AcrR family transcriptional regulator
VTAAPSTAERILDAAEAVFASQGYHAATIRRITAVAGVELSLSRYHFGSKDELFRQVVMRRADTCCSLLEAALDRALAEGPAPRLEVVVEAMISPAAGRLASGDDGWRNYFRLLVGLGGLAERPDLTAPWLQRYRPVWLRYAAALQAALPGASVETVHSGLNFLQILAGHALLDIDLMRQVAGQADRPIDWPRLRRQLICHAVGGLRAQAGLAQTEDIA